MRCPACGGTVTGGVCLQCGWVGEGLRPRYKRAVISSAGHGRFRPRGVWGKVLELVVTALVTCAVLAAITGALIFVAEHLSDHGDSADDVPVAYTVATPEPPAPLKTAPRKRPLEPGAAGRQ